MATTTTNFGWDIPQSTDLVKDGATAIAALGQDIDTALVDLKGGTTGQVLSKASNTDLDYTWVTQDDANAIQNSIVDAKGDLISATGNDVPARLAVGNNGETLVADSSTATGLRYTAGNPICNPVLNSCYDIWQRGTSISLGASTSYTNGYIADRWQTSTSTNQASTVSRQATGDTTNLPNIQYALRFQRNSGQTGTSAMGFYQSFESTNSIPFVGKTVTFSFYARAGANFSPTSSALLGRVYSGTGTDQTIFAYSGLTSVINTTATLTTTWQRFTATATIGATATEIALGFEWTPTGTAGAADYFEVTGVQLDIGSVALPYRRNSVTLQGELAACQRYAYVIRQDGSANVANVAFGNAFTSTQTFHVLPLQVEMRTAPTATFGTASNYLVTNGGGSGIACTTVTSASAQKNMVSLYGTVASGLTTGQGSAFQLAGSTSASIILSAEL